MVVVDEIELKSLIANAVVAAVAEAVRPSLYTSVKAKGDAPPGMSRRSFARAASKIPGAYRVGVRGWYVSRADFEKWLVSRGRPVLAASVAEANARRGWSQ